MPAPGRQSDEVDKLKALLFSPESARLAAAEAHIDALEGRVGDAPKLEAATAEILVEALRRAEVARHRELAAAIAPVVVAAIRSEIHNSRDMMVEALYPITGRLVAAAVANAFRDLVESINRRLDALVSSNQWKLRLQSLVSGRSVAEIALAQAMGVNFQRILLFERGSGILLANWSARTGQLDNPELISGLMAAINEFATTVLANQSGELRTLDLGASRVFLRASSRIVLAAEVTGEPSRDDVDALDAAFLDIVERHDRREVIQAADLDALAARFGAPAPAKAARSKLGIAALLVAGLVALALIAPVRRWQREAAIASAFDRARADNPALNAYPLRLSIDHSAGTVSLQGLIGSASDAAQVSAAVAAGAAPYRVSSDIAVVASEAQLQASAAQSSALAARLDGVEKRVDAAIAAAVAATGAEQTVQKQENATLRREMAAGLAGAATAVATARQDLGADIAGKVEALAADLRALKDSQTQAARENSTAVASLRNDASADLASKSAAIDALAADLDAGKNLAAHQTEENVAKIEALRADFDKGARLEETHIAQVEQFGAATAARLDPLSAKLDEASLQIARIRASAAAPIPPAPSAHAALLAGIDGVAIFFTTQDDFVSPAAADAHLDAIAALLKQTGESLRVVGYADDTGGAPLNAENSRKRAAKVTRLLVERGVSADKIVAVARSAQMPIADASSPQHARNRRVMFEPLLSDELAP